MGLLQGLKNKFSRQSQNELELQESLMGADEEKKEDVREQMAAMNTVLEDVCNPNDEKDKSFEEIGDAKHVVPSQVKPGGKKAFDKANAEHGVIQMFSGLDRMIANTKQTIEACKEIKTELQNLGEAAAADRQRAEADRQRAEADMNDLKRMMGMLLRGRAPEKEKSEERKVSFTEKENRKRELGEKNQRR